jgi:hypothetical protein
MPFLAINGVPFPAAEGSAEETIREVGSTTQAFDGTLRKNRITSKRDLRVRTTLLAEDEAIAWEGVVRGLGHAWPGTGGNMPYSSKGLAPSATSGTPTYTGTAVQLDSTESVTWSVGAGAKWTVWFFMEQPAATFTHYVITSAGNKWVDGVSNNAASTAFVTVSTTLKLEATGGVARNFNDIAFMPFEVPDSWPPGLFAVLNSSATPSTPKFYLTGDAVQGTGRVVIGTVESVSYRQGYVGGQWHNNLRELTILLQEV